MSCPAYPPLPWSYQIWSGANRDVSTGRCSMLLRGISEMETERMDAEKITDSRNSYVKVVEGNLLEGFCAGAGTSAVTDWRWCYCVCVHVCTRVCTCMCMMRYGWGKENKWSKSEIFWEKIYTYRIKIWQHGRKLLSNYLGQLRH